MQSLILRFKMLPHIFLYLCHHRSQVFNEVAEVLEMVDSKGAGEIVGIMRL